MEYEGLILQKEGNIAIIKLNRPEKLNALTKPMVEKALPSVAEELRKDKDVRVVVITGMGRGFCGGFDVADMAAMGSEVETNKVGARETMLEFMKCFALSLQNLEKPAIAAINGAAVGIGITLAAFCDIRIASEDSIFTMAFVKRGVVPDCGSTYILPRLMGLSKTLELMFTGDIIDAKEAERLGLVDKVVPSKDLMNVTMELAGKIAQGPPITIKLIKEAAYRGIYNSLEQQLEFETCANELCMKTEDHHEGVKAFLEKREPVFRGQ